MSSKYNYCCTKNRSGHLGISAGHAGVNEILTNLLRLLLKVGSEYHRLLSFSFLSHASRLKTLVFVNSLKQAKRCRTRQIKRQIHFYLSQFYILLATTFLALLISIPYGTCLELSPLHPYLCQTHQASELLKLLNFSQTWVITSWST